MSIRLSAGSSIFSRVRKGLPVLAALFLATSPAAHATTYTWVSGTTGATHILEHLMFKGSEGFNDPAGNSMAARIAMMAMTTKSSIKVKARHSRRVGK